MGPLGHKREEVLLAGFGMVCGHCDTLRLGLKGSCHVISHVITHEWMCGGTGSNGK